MPLRGVKLIGLCLKVKGERFITELAPVGRQLKMNKHIFRAEARENDQNYFRRFKTITAINLGVRWKPATNK